MKFAQPVSLAEIAARVPDSELITWDEFFISGVTDDSRKVERGMLYIAMPSETGDTFRYIADAQRRGAAAVLLASEWKAQYPAPAVPHIYAPNIHFALADIASWAQGEPARALTLLGVTGTNGKTTTALMMAAIVEAAGQRVGFIGTLGAAYAGKIERFGYTTPPPLQLHELFARMRAADVTHVAMEVSSHSLALERVAGLRFQAGAFTNISRDHLDFHKTEAAYIAAKRKLFERTEHAILNFDDPVGRAYYEEFGGTGYTLDDSISVSIGGTLIARQLALDAQGSTFILDGHEFRVLIPGRFNVANALAAIGAARALGIDDATSSRALRNMVQVPGRMERFEGAGCSVIVDYAHSPDALARVLTTIREMRPTRVTVVFGCGGDRDPGKRPQMGTIADQLADRVILTADNPRSESALDIIAQIRVGMSREPIVEENRGHAIARAIMDAIDGEVVLVAGKGAEPEQIIGTRHIPFADDEHVRVALAVRQSNYVAHKD